jgi:hypothetical protein
MRQRGSGPAPRHLAPLCQADDTAQAIEHLQGLRELLQQLYGLFERAISDAITDREAVRAFDAVLGPPVRPMRTHCDDGQIEQAIDAAEKLVSACRLEIDRRRADMVDDTETVLELAALIDHPAFRSACQGADLALAGRSEPGH